MGKRDQSKIDRPGKIGPQRRGYRYPTTSDGNRRVYKIQVNEIKLLSSHTNFALDCTSSRDSVGNETPGATRLMVEVNSHSNEINQMHLYATVSKEKRPRKGRHIAPKQLERFHLIYFRAATESAMTRTETEKLRVTTKSHAHVFKINALVATKSLRNQKGNGTRPN